MNISKVPTLGTVFGLSAGHLVGAFAAGEGRDIRPRTDIDRLEWLRSHG